MSILNGVCRRLYRNLGTVTITLYVFDVENNLQLQGKPRIFLIQSDWSLLKLQQDPSAKPSVTYDS